MRAKNAVINGILEENDEMDLNESIRQIIIDKLEIDCKKEDIESVRRIVETWCEDNDVVPINGYGSFVKKPNKIGEGGRKSGGIVIYYREEIKNKTKLLKNNTKESIWISTKIRKKKFIICDIYNPPKYSKYANEEFFNCLQNEIKNMEYKYLNAELIIVGDMNGRIGEIQERDHENEAKYSNVVNNFNINLENRRNKDKEINEYGEKIIQVCKDLDMVILNSRCKGNKEGEYTFVSENGKSAIDLVIKTNLHEQYILDMAVIGCVENSKHFPIEISLNIYCNKVKEIPKEKFQTLEVYKWNNQKCDEFKSNMVGRVDLWLFGIENGIRKNEINEAHKILEMMYKSIGKSMRVVNNTNNYLARNNWFDRECREAKHNTRNALRIFRRSNIKRHLDDYRILKKQYVNLCIRKNDEMKAIREGEIMRMVKERDEVEQSQLDEEFYINPGSNSNDMVIEMLEREIDENEVEYAISTLKNRKTPGIDGIPAEFIKNSTDYNSGLKKIKSLVNFKLDFVRDMGHWIT
ncbi:uncharacterized protein LOC123302291 [Chrysoperla carnea]|uniref:uncharacterized protein LOC123302291 n=1 Tax=Chrysoperla carnea TaxID=189513 RepID=UPI001D06AA4C|nr:uncharacterized protein LOC123302291 [Chrysoperla carnea]